MSKYKVVKPFLDDDNKVRKVGEEYAFSKTENDLQRVVYGLIVETEKKAKQKSDLENKNIK